METGLETKVERLSENVATLVTEMRFYRPMIEQQVTTLTNVENRLTRMEERAVNNSETIAKDRQDFKDEIAELKRERDADKGAMRWAVMAFIAIIGSMAAWLTYTTNHLINK